MDCWLTTRSCRNTIFSLNHISHCYDLHKYIIGPLLTLRNRKNDGDIKFERSLLRAMRGGGGFSKSPTKLELRYQLGIA
jgi:hypothetical protein